MKTFWQKAGFFEWRDWHERGVWDVTAEMQSRRMALVHRPLNCSDRDVFWGMKITPVLFEGFLKCPTKCWLRSQGETDTGNEYANWVRDQNESYRIQAGKRLAADIPLDQYATTPPQPENLKSVKWRFALDVVVIHPSPALKCKTVDLAIRLRPFPRGIIFPTFPTIKTSVHPSETRKSFGESNA